MDEIELGLYSLELLQLIVFELLTLAVLLKARFAMVLLKLVLQRLLEHLAWSSFALIGV